MKELYKGYLIESKVREVSSNKWAVHVQISRNANRNIFYSSDKIYYILEVEAALEAINMGKNLIEKNLVGF